MEDFLNKYPSVKRLGVTLITGAIISLNKKLGLNLGLEEIGALTALAMTFLGQSMVVQKARIAGETATEVATARTPEQTAASLGGKTAGEISETQAGPKVM